MIHPLAILAGLFGTSQLFVLGACAVMAGTRRSSKPWFYATEMLFWSTLAGLADLVCFFAVGFLGGR